MGGRSLVISQGRKVGFLNFPRNYFFGGVGWGGWGKGLGIYIYIYIFVFFSFVIS
jgi:hypothetical protein